MVTPPMDCASIVVALPAPTFRIWSETAPCAGQAWTRRRSWRMAGLVPLRDGETLRGGVDSGTMTVT